jgi:acyl-CoA thioesterase FadM
MVNKKVVHMWFRRFALAASSEHLSISITDFMHNSLYHDFVTKQIRVEYFRPFFHDRTLQYSAQSKKYDSPVKNSVTRDRCYAF